MLKTRFGPAAVSVALLACAASAHAQTLPNQPMLGLATQNKQGVCYIKRGPVIFQRKFSTPLTAGTKAIVNIDEIFAGLNSTQLSLGYELSGQATMTFTNSTSGRIRFKQLASGDPNYYNPLFFQYSETFNATSSQLTVSFLVRFPGCDLPIYMVFDVIL